MKFDRASDIEQECWSMKLADQSRGTRRALIDDLFNGFPPYSPEQVQQNNITVNSSNLVATRIHANAVGQCKNALLSTNQYFAVKVDRGPMHKRSEYSEIITSELRKAMKEGAAALRYTEKIKNVSSSLVLHGAGPTVWDDRYQWTGGMQSMEDVLIPSRTLLSMENLEHFAVYRRYTPARLSRMISRVHVDKGWNIPVAKAAIAWAKKQPTGTDANDYVSGFSPERLAEDTKENGGIWSTDQVPTIGAYEFYFTDYDEKNFGWKRRIVLDSPDVYGIKTPAINASSKNILNDRNQFLYDSGDRTYASRLSEILQFQFADGSVVAPHRYHSIRGLGFLLYTVCELQNRLYCSFTEAAFEAAMQYFRSASSDDVERILKLNLVNRATIPEGVSFVKPEERWRVDEALLEKVFNLNKETIADSSTGYNRNFGHEDAGPEKTATQITAEVNASSALVGAMLQDLYRYQKYEYREIARRFCIKDSRDVDVKKFRAACITRGVPEEILNVDCWEISVEQIMGNGNKQLAIAQAQMLLTVIDRLDPDAQRIVLRDFAFAVTGDPSKTNELVPLKTTGASDSVHDAELSATRMIIGLPMGLKQGVNHGEYAAMILASIAMKTKQIATRGMATPEEIAGLQIAAGQTLDGQAIPGPNGPGNGVVDHIAILAQNPASKQEVKQLGDALRAVMNEVKAFAQRLQEQQGQAQAQNGNGEMDVKDAAKAKAMLMQAEIKAKNMAESHAQRSKQKDEIHAQALAERQANAQFENAEKLRRLEVDEAATDLKTAAEIKREAAKPAEPATAE